MADDRPRSPEDEPEDEVTFTLQLGGAKDRLLWVLEKLELAVAALTKDAPIKTRLYEAMIELVEVQPGEFPVNLQARYQAILDAVRQMEGPHGTLVASLEQMSEARAEEIAQAIIALRDEVQSRIS